MIFFSVLIVRTRSGMSNSSGGVKLLLARYRHRADEDSRQTCVFECAVE